MTVGIWLWLWLWDSSGDEGSDFGDAGIRPDVAEVTGDPMGLGLGWRRTRGCIGDWDGEGIVYAAVAAAAATAAADRARGKGAEWNWI